MRYRVWNDYSLQVESRPPTVSSVITNLGASILSPLNPPNIEHSDLDRRKTIYGPVASPYDFYVPADQMSGWNRGPP